MVDETQARELGLQIAHMIRAELVCCDVYDRDKGTDRAGKHHSICFWGEAGARIALHTTALYIDGLISGKPNGSELLEQIERTVAERRYVRRSRPRRHLQQIVDDNQELLDRLKESGD